MRPGKISRLIQILPTWIRHCILKWQCLEDKKKAGIVLGECVLHTKDGKAEAGR